MIRLGSKSFNLNPDGVLCVNFDFAKFCAYMLS